MPLLLIGMLSLILSILNNYILVGVVGFISIYFYMVFWLASFSSINYTKRKIFFDYYVHISIAFAAVTAIFAIYQYFFDPTLFGVKPSRIYSDIELLDASITRRATSFLGSPQNLGIYFGLMIGCLTLVNYKKVVKTTLYLLFIVGGVLSGSKAFVVFMILFLFAYNFRSKQLKGIRGFFKIVIGFFLLFAILQMQSIENLKNTKLSAFYIFGRFNARISSEYRLDTFFFT